MTTMSAVAYITDPLPQYASPGAPLLYPMIVVGRTYGSGGPQPYGNPIAHWPISGGNPYADAMQRFQYESLPLIQYMPANEGTIQPPSVRYPMGPVKPLPGSGGGGGGGGQSGYSF